MLDKSRVLASSDDDEETEKQDEDEKPVSRPGIGARSHHPSAQTSPVKVLPNPLLQPPPAVSPLVNGKKAHHSGGDKDPADSKVTKKRKTGDSSVPTAIADSETKSSEQSATNPTTSKTKPGRRSTARFERIKADKVAFADERLKNNNFESRVCPPLSFKPHSSLCALMFHAGRWNERLWSEGLRRFNRNTRSGLQKGEEQKEAWVIPWRRYYGAFSCLTSDSTPSDCSNRWLATASSLMVDGLIPNTFILPLSEFFGHIRRV